MRVTVFKAGNLVSVNGVQHTVDCSKLPGSFHVLQWYGNAGDLEFASELKREMVDGVMSARWHKEPNVIIHDFDPYRPYVAAWDVVDAKLKADYEAAKAEQESPDAP